MTLNERIALGREYAHGINRMVDINRAYQLWHGVEHMLGAEDREVFDIIAEMVGESSYQAPCGAGFIQNCANNFYMGQNPGDYLVQAANTTTKHNEAEVRALFDEIIAAATKGKKLDTLYKSLELYKKNQLEEKKKTKKPENVLFGNNLNYLIYYYWSSVEGFYREMNKRLVAEGFEEKKSKQGFYQIIHGENGMDNSGKMILVKMVNEIRMKRRGFVRQFAVQDMYLPFSEFIQLFTPQKIDDRFKEILADEKKGLY